MDFSEHTINVPALAIVTLNFTNNDSGLIHNFAVYTDSNATNLIFRGSDITGPGRVPYQFQAPQRGTYFFRCDHHPTAMWGTFVVQ